MTSADTQHSDNSVFCGRARIVCNRRVSPNWYLLRLLEPTIANHARPGMFVQISCRETGSFDPLLRRPFSVYYADKSEGTFDVLYTTVGRGTHWMAALPDPSADDTTPCEASGGSEPLHAEGWPPTLDVLGPLGNTFTSPEATDLVFMVGGGVGVAPLYFLARELLAGAEPPRITACIGAQSAPLLQGVDDFRRLTVRTEVSTDDGSEGFAGRVTELFLSLLEGVEDRSRLRVYGCGPQGMNESLRALAAAEELRCEICLESLMACGFGICFGCVAPIRKGVEEDFVNRRICWEGPVFDSRLLHPGIVRS